jgi:hypothetical protein
MQRHEEWRAALSACRGVDVERYWTQAEVIALTAPTNLDEVAVQFGLLRELVRPENMAENDLERLLIVSLSDAFARLAAC